MSLIGLLEKLFHIDEKRQKIAELHLKERFEQEEKHIESTILQLLHHNN